MVTPVVARAVAEREEILLQVHKLNLVSMALRIPEVEAAEPRLSMERKRQAEAVVQVLKFHGMSWSI